jgi:hypothetical protein
LCHCGPEKRYGSTAVEADAAAVSLSSSTVITLGPLDEEDEVPVSTTEDEAFDTALGLASTEAEDDETALPPLP